MNQIPSTAAKRRKQVRHLGCIQELPRLLHPPTARQDILIAFLGPRLVHYEARHISGYQLLLKSHPQGAVEHRIMLLKRCLGERGTVVVLLKVARAGNDSPVSNIEGPNTHVHGSLLSVAIAAHGSREEGELSHGVNWLGGVCSTGVSRACL